MTRSLHCQQPRHEYDEGIAFLCAAKGEPYSWAEWEAEVARLEAKLADAKQRMTSAGASGYYPPARFQ